MLDVENDPALLAVSCSEQEITLRVDSDLFASDTGISDAVETFVLSAPQLSAEDLRLTEDAAGKIVHIRVLTDGSQTLLRLWLNFASEAVEMRCEQLSRTVEPYSLQDLAMKVSILRSLYLDAADAHDTVHANLSGIQARVGKLVGHEIRIAEEKSRFFETTDPGRAAAFRRSVEVLNRIIAGLQEGDLPA